MAESLERVEHVGRLLRLGMRFDAVAETPEALGVMLGDLVARVRRLEGQVVDLRGWVCDSCFDTNRHHCSTCVAAGRS